MFENWIFTGVLVIGFAMAGFSVRAQEKENVLTDKDATPDQLITDFQFTEGPVWLPGHNILIFSDIPASTIYQEDGVVFRKPSGQSNGLTLDREGRLIAAEHETRRVTRTEGDGTITILAESYDGKRLNSPNDVIVRSDGMIFFTDPPYGLPGMLEGPHAELTFSGVYALLPGEELVLLIDDFDKPNGLTLSPDESILYVADTDGAHIRAFDVAEDGTLSNDRHFYDLPTPDGIKTDTQGRIWATARDGVHVISPDGERVLVIECPEIPANLCFGGENGDILYVTARNSVYQITTNVEGIRPTVDAVFSVVDNAKN